MSRNLGRTSCHRCSREVVLVGLAAPITTAQAGVYFDEYEGMIVADAECGTCGAKYLAWLDGTARKQYTGWPQPWRDEHGDWFIQDLSYRSSFDNEPGDGDLPPWRWKWAYEISSFIGYIREYATSLRALETRLGVTRGDGYGWHVEHDRTGTLTVTFGRAYIEIDVQ